MKTLRFYVGIGGRAFARRRVSRTVARYYPGGFTLQRAAGAWRGPGGRLIREPALVVTICGRPDTDNGSTCAHALAVALKQQSILVTECQEVSGLVE